MQLSKSLRILSAISAIALIAGSTIVIGQEESSETLESFARALKGSPFTTRSKPSSRKVVLSHHVYAKSHPARHEDYVRFKESSRRRVAALPFRQVRTHEVARVPQGPKKPPLVVQKEFIKTEY